MKKKLLLYLITALISISFIACKEDIYLESKKLETQTEMNLKSAGISSLIWGDEFNYNGLPNSSKWQTNTWWTYRFRYENLYNGDYWSFNNGDWNLANSVTLLDQSTNTVYVDGNYLRIKSSHDITAPNNNICDFSAGYIESEIPFKYGYFEIKAKIPKGDCIGSSFWLTGDEELDIFESYGWNTYTYPTNLHKTFYPSSPEDIDLSYDLADDFHNYGFSWGNGSATWYIDNKIVRSVYDANRVGNSDCYLVLSINLPDARASIPMITNSKNQNDNFDDFIIDYVRVYNTRPTNALFTTLNNNGQITTLSDYTDWDSTWDIIVSGDFNGDSYDDLMLYNKSDGKVAFLSTNGIGDVDIIYSNNSWGTWDQIIAGNFGGSSKTDLLLYNSQNGEAKFYSLDGTFNSTTNITGLSNSLKIVSGNFNSQGLDDLFFYDSASGEVNVKQVINYNTLQSLNHITGWRKTWDQIVTGNFGGSGLTDLLLYDKQNGEAEFYCLDGTYNSSSTITGWRKTWKIISGNFNLSSTNDELLFYDTNNNGQAYFYSTNYNTGINLYKSYNDWSPSWNIIVSGQFGSTSNHDILFYDN